MGTKMIKEVEKTLLITKFFEFLVQLVFFHRNDRIPQNQKKRDKVADTIGMNQIVSSIQLTNTPRKDNNVTDIIDRCVKTEIHQNNQKLKIRMILEAR